MSALSNKANLAGSTAGWLVFGVRNSTWRVVGTEYRRDPERLNGLKKQVSDGTGPSLTLRSIRVFDRPNGRVIIFEIPPAPQGIPISWKGHFYSRAGESLEPLSIEKQDAIRQESSMLDWTGQTLEDASVDDLSPKALAVAREAFTQRNSARIPRKEIEGWDDDQVLTHVGLKTKHGLTRAAILLLGKPESAYILNPLMAELT